MAAKRSAKRSAKPSKATKPWPYGHTHWLWFGTRKKGQWYQVDLGGGPKRGGKVMNPNKLKIKGKKLFQLMAVHCKPPQADMADPCSSCCCTYEMHGGQWVLQTDNCGNCGGGCVCTPPGAPGVVYKDPVPAVAFEGATCTTFCSGP